MNKKEYLGKRNALLAEAGAFLNKGDVEAYKAKEKEITDLDDAFEKVAKAAANMNALAGKTVVTNIETKGVEDKTFTPANQKINNTITPPEDKAKAYRAAFAKNMMGLPMDAAETELFDEVNATFRNTVQTAATHVVLVPETVKAGIWQEIGEAHPIVGDMAMTFVKGDLTIIKETASGDDAAWYDEDTATTESDTAFGELNLTGCELAKDITVSWKMKKMSIDAFLAYITTKIAEKMGNALAKGVVEGKGKPGAGDTFKPQPKGIAVALEAEATTPQIVTYAAAADVNYKLMTSVMAKIKSGYLNGAAVYATNDVIWNILANIVDDNGKPMFVPDVSAGGVGRLFGLPVKEEDGVSADEVLIGNVAKGYAINANENITMYQEDHIKARTTDYMGYAIIDGDVITTKAFVLLKKS